MRREREGEEERESGREGGGKFGVPFNVSFFRLRHENNQLHDLLDLRDKEHHSAIAKLHQQHQETIQKVCVWLIYNYNNYNCVFICPVP